MISALIHTDKRKNILPSEVKEYLLSDQIFDEYEQTLKEFDVSPDDAIQILSKAFYAFLEQGDSVEHLREQLQVQLGITKEKSVSILLRLFSRVAFFFTPHIEDLTSKIQAWSQVIAQFKYPVPASEFVRAFLLPLDDTGDQQAIHRLELMLLKYIRGERSKEETVVFLQRPPKLGGIETDEQSARNTIELFDAQRAAVKIIDESQEKKMETSERVEPVSVKKTMEEEVVMPVIKPSLMFLTDDVPLDVLVKRICTNEVFSFSDPHMQQRCIQILEARMRDLRDAFQTKETLERSVQSGGLGMSGRRLVDMVELIEKVVDAEKQKKQAVLESQHVQQLELKQQHRDEKQKLQVKEEQVMAKRYVQTTGVVPTQRASPAAPALSRASAAISAHVQLQQQEARIDTQKVRAAVEKTVRDKPVSAAPTLIGKPKMQDIQLSRRLSGPIEELQAMSLTEFRRLSSDPSQAVDRIKDIVNLLEDQGYSKRVAGLQALRQSPLMRLYGTVTQQALLEGTSVDAVLAANKSGEGMKKSEYEALMKLNAELRV